MKLIDILLEDTIEENLFKKIGSFLKSAFNKFVGTLKKVMNKLPLGKSTTITITIPIPLQEDAFGTLAGTYVEHATAYHLASILLEENLNVEPSLAELQSTMESSYERMADAANSKQISNDTPQKELAGKELAKAIRQGLEQQLGELRELEDLAVTTFIVKQVGSEATGTGSKSDLDLIVRKADVETIFKRFSLKATSNVTDTTGVDALLKLTARIFLPELLNDAGRFVGDSARSEVMSAYPEVEAIFKEIEEKAYLGDYKTFKKKVSRFVRDGRTDLTAKFGAKRDKKIAPEIYKYLTKEKGYKGVHEPRPGFTPAMFILSNSSHFETEEDLKNFEIQQISKFKDFIKKELSKPGTSQNFVKNLLGIDDITDFYGYIAKHQGIISEHHSPAFSEAVQHWMQDGGIDIKDQQSGDQGFLIEHKGVTIFRFSFQMFTTFNQMFTHDKLAKKL